MCPAAITYVSYRWESSNATLMVLYLPTVGLWVGLHLSNLILLWMKLMLVMRPFHGLDLG
ncbi:hypothetical protein Gohar_021738, partial [Gossypium harknessii]|nr:hypothetical protein [Gossypium harknessii]